MAPPWFDGVGRETPGRRSVDPGRCPVAGRCPVVGREGGVGRTVLVLGRAPGRVTPGAVRDSGRRTLGAGREMLVGFRCGATLGRVRGVTSVGLAELGRIGRVVVTRGRVGRRVVGGRAVVRLGAGARTSRRETVDGRGREPVVGRADGREAAGLGRRCGVRTVLGRLLVGREARVGADGRERLTLGRGAGARLAAGAARVGARRTAGAACTRAFDADDRCGGFCSVSEDSPAALTPPAHSARASTAMVANRVFMAVSLRVDARPRRAAAGLEWVPRILPAR